MLPVQEGIYNTTPFPLQITCGGLPDAPGRRATTQGIVRFGNLRGLVRGEEEAGEEEEEEEEEEERCGSL